MREKNSFNLFIPFNIPSGKLRVDDIKERVCVPTSSRPMHILDECYTFIDICRLFYNNVEIIHFHFLNSFLCIILNSFVLYCIKHL